MTEGLNDLDAERALFDGKIQGVVAAIYENERPLTGLAGMLDWRFEGAISRSVRAGEIRGAAGECVYFPVMKNGKAFHLILIGAGRSSSPGARTSSLPADSLKILQKNIASLKLSQLAISKSDLGASSVDQLHKKGGSLWIVK